MVGVLLTGMGDDGADAMVKIRQAGGYTIAESEETAIVFGMPMEAIKRGGADVALPSYKIADEVRKLSQRSEEAAIQIGNTIKKMTSYIDEKFKDKIDKSKTVQEEDFLKTLEAQLKSIEVSYQNIKEINSQILTETSDMSQNINMLIFELLADIQFQDITRQQLQAVIDTLLRMQAHLEAVIKQGKDDLFDMQQIKDLYTMDSQRQIHRNNTQGSVDVW